MSDEQDRRPGQGPAGRVGGDPRRAVSGGRQRSPTAQSPVGGAVGPFAADTFAEIEAIAEEHDIPVGALIRGWVLPAVAAERDLTLEDAVDRLAADADRLRRLVHDSPRLIRHHPRDHFAGRCPRSLRPLLVEMLRVSPALRFVDDGSGMMIGSAHSSLRRRRRSPTLDLPPAD